MPVIINEFEIVNDEPPAARRGSDNASSEQAPRGPTLRPADIERIIRHFQERRARVRAD
jgi:hypothetical protein